MRGRGREGTKLDSELGTFCRTQQSQPQKGKHGGERERQADDDKCACPECEEEKAARLTASKAKTLLQERLQRVIV